MGFDLSTLVRIRPCGLEPRRCRGYLQGWRPNSMNRVRSMQARGVAADRLFRLQRGPHELDRRLAAVDEEFPTVIARNGMELVHDRRFGHRGVEPAVPLDEPVPILLADVEVDPQRMELSRVRDREV